MQTQIQCPQCGTPFVAEVNQIIDVDQNPQLKQALLSGQVNMAVCPRCGAGGQLAAPLVYHDSAHELFMIYVPTEMPMNQMEREQMIGRLTRQVVDNLPPEKRKAYLFQPQMILNMQTFYEKVLETEGVTKEMIERQRKQSELLTTLLRADNDVADYLIKERISEIDETFFAMLQQYLDMAAQTQQEKELVKLTNLRAKLMTETPAGRQMEKQQIAMHALNRDAKKSGGLTPELLLKHILINIDDDRIVGSMVNAVQGALSYEFFALITAEVEKLEGVGEQEKAGKLTALRNDLVELQQAMQQESQRMVEEATKLLDTLLKAPDMKTAVQQNMNQFDDAFMYVLSANVAQAEQNENNQLLQALTQLQSLIVQEVESQYPPEIIFLNQLMEAETAIARDQLLSENQQLVTPNLLKMLEAVEKQIEEMGQEELNGRLQAVKQAIKARI
ncbi:MAG: CpXC domain-containing protein [Ardenticatenaceae bacterium]|nr:CpXC domain-containing protein [Anaerolineales bacterium]MCB8920019.1 CpXC domain-containing protein [Ardenticatenaceae bacterium]MCB8989864.1 CpXC domain-containing protein [Ardenticatenaceae bacterium]